MFVYTITIHICRYTKYMYIYILTSFIYNKYM